jgi:hypothetical protein
MSFLSIVLDICRASVSNGTSNLRARQPAG